MARTSSLFPPRWLIAAAALSAVTCAQKICMTATLDAAQETPPNASTARGTAFCVLDRDANTLTYTAQITGLSSAETAAHIHGFAGPGVAAGVKTTIPAGSFKTGVWSYVEADEASIVAGLTYFNIHTSAFSGGEIRGQILKSDAPATLMALADGAQQTPPNASAAKGVGFFKFDTIANSITYDFTMNGLGSAETAAHIHGFAPPGVSAGVKITLPVGNHKSGVLAYVQADEASYLAGLSYINIHTASLGGGEIRGQIIPGCTNPSTYCTAKTNSQGCLPAIGWAGMPNLAGPDDFHVTCSNVLNQKSGIFYFGFAPKSAPFLGGTQCVASPTQRTPIQSSGGNAPPDDCSGVFDYFFTDAKLAAAGPAGTLVYGEYWSRDPADAQTVSLSNGIQFAILP